MSKRSIERPSRAEIGRIAENQPALLNLLLAYFVFEWREVRVGTTSVGMDQTGQTCLVPDYVSHWGVDAAVHYLLRCPERRDVDDPGFVSEWLEEISAPGAPP